MLKVLARNLGANWVGHLLLSVAGFITLPIVLSRLGTEAYGLWVAVVSVIAYTEVLQAGLGETIVRALAVRIGREQWQACNTFFSFAVYAFALVSLLVAVAACGLWFVVIQFIPTSARLTHLVLPIAALVTLGTMVPLAFTPFSAVLWARERFDLVNAVAVGGRLAFLIAIIPLLHGERGILVLAALRLGIGAVSQVATVLLARRVMPTLRLVPWREARATYREIAHFTGWVFLRVVAGRTAGQSDVVILSLVRGPAAVAVYSIARSLVDYTQALLDKLEVISPTAAVLHGRGDRERMLRLFAASGKGATMLALAASSYLVVFGRELIKTWVGAGFADAALILDVLVIALIVKAPLLPSRSVLLATGEARQPALLAVLDAVLTLSLSIGLGIRYGAIGVAAGMAIPAVVVWGARFVPVLSHKLGISTWSVVRTLYLSPMRGAVLPLALCVAVAVLWRPSGYPALLGLVPVVGLLFAASFYVLGLDSSERNAVRELLRVAGRAVARAGARVGVRGGGHGAGVPARQPALRSATSEPHRPG